MSSNASSSHRWKRDVFLSFRGEDTRRGFTDHLYNTLKQKGVDTFRDDEKLERGKDINPELLRSIEESRFAVVIFSRNYACSKWCLDELQKIAECKKNMGQTVLPVFHGVDPSHVRKQEGDFRAAFDKHEQDFKDNMEKVNKWREALTEVANISGWDLTNRHESEVIQEIAKTILNKLNVIFSTDNKDLVGIGSRLLKMDSYLDIGSDEVRTIGIWGAGGIGKTTLAKQIFKRIRDEFEASCFLANVREESQKHGIVHMQTRLYEILAQNQAKIQMDDMGVDVLMRALHSKRVLVVLDDVDQLKHLEALVGRASGQHNSFGSGSRIIVTTRDKHLLKMYGNIVYEVEKLDNVEALQLLSQGAFNQDCPPDDDYKKLSENVVKYADGLPLALEVLGSFLYGRDKDEWSGTIHRLRDNPKSEIYKTLRLSYDGLEQTEKQTFLDIACFFKGEDVVRVKKILDGCELHPTIGIRVLTEKSLIFIEGGKIWMHDLLQEMGWEIVREESPQEPGKRSRLWLHKDSYQVLAENKGTSAVHGIFLCSQANREFFHNANSFLEIRDLRPVKFGKLVYYGRAENGDFQKLLIIDQEMHLNCDPFVESKNLRLLKIHNLNISGCLNYSLPKSLRLLEWHGYPLKSLPSNFQLENLVELSMPNSRIEQLPKLEALHLGILISINLSNCEYLINTPDFTKIPNLEILILEGCIKLQEVHPSVGVLEHLVFLNLNGCKCLQKLPYKISLRSLETFILSGCSNLSKFPEIVGDMKNLSQLYLDGTAIRELPISINQLTGLTLLDLSYCENLSSLPSNEICGLTALKTLRLSHCSKIDQLPENLGSLKELEELYVNGTAVRRVPSSILCLDNLKHLSFRGCHTGSGTQRSWKSLIYCCLLPTDHHSEMIDLQMPNSFAGSTSLISLDLSHCNLQEGAIPNDIGCLSSLQKLDLSGNNFKVIPKSFSQLSKLRELKLSYCRELLSLPHPLPLSLKYLYARNCPNLVTKLSQYRDILISDNGFHLIDCRKSPSFGDDQAFLERHSMPDEYSDLLLTKHIEDSINHGKSFKAIFSYPARIPEWCSKWSNNGSSVTIKLSPEDNFGMRKGFALFFAFEIKEQDNIHEGLELQKIGILFHSDEGNYLSFLPNYKIPAAGSFGVCCYLPRRRFQEKYLNQASCEFGALILTEGQDLKIKRCGLRIIFEQDAEEFSQTLFKTLTESRDLDLNFIQHCRKFLDAARELNNLGEPIMDWDYSSCKEQGSGELQKEQGKRIILRLERTCTTKNPNSSSEDCVDTQMERDTQTLLSRLFEGRYAHYNQFSFIIPVQGASCWFLHHCVGDTAICYLPSNLYDDERWVGLDVYATFERSNPSETPSLLLVDLYAHGTDNGMFLPILTFLLTMNGLLRSSFVQSHIPRAYFPKQLNQCQGISVLFTPVALSNVKVDLRVVICGTRLLYEQDSTSFIDGMVDLASADPVFLELLHYQVKSHLQKEEGILCKAKTLKQIEAIGPSTLEWSILQSLQELLTSTKPLAKDVANTLEKYRFSRAQNKAFSEPMKLLVHSKEFSSEILHHIQRSDQVLMFNHFHIMPDKFLRFRGELNEWRQDLEIFLKLFFNDEGLLITLSVGGKLIAVTKRFDPNLVFNFCFPQKEMLDCFQDRSSTSRVAIELPPNLYNDSSWEGLAVCAAFSVKEHPNAFSEISVDLVCHLSVNGHCLDPVPSFSVTKDRYKWLHLRGFIWLTYLPRKILIELHQQSTVEASIFSSCPGLIVNMCGIRVLYHQDVEDFRHAIIQCSTSIFDTSEIFQYVDPIGVGIGTVAGLLFDKEENSFGIADEQNTPLPANDRKDNTESRVLDESTIDQSTFRQTSNEEFDQNLIYSSCFPAMEIQDWFGDQSRFDSSGKIHLPPDRNDDNNWIGLTMCAYFSDSEITEIDHNSDPEIVPHVTLICQFETENGSLKPLRHHQTTEKDLNLLRRRGFIWLSFLPRQWFYEANHEAPYQLNECRVMKAAFGSDIGGVCVRRCVFRLLYQHEVEEFKQTIRHCVLNTSSPCDKKISESSTDKLLKDKGKRILE